MEAPLMTALRELKDKVRTALNWVDLLKGMQTFKETGQTPNKAYQAMIRLHGRTYGRSTNWIANRYATLREENAVGAVSGILGNLSENEIARINNQIKENGYYVFNQVVPEAICDQITQFGLATPSLIETEDHKDHQSQLAIFDPEKPISKTYKIPENFLVTNPMVQELMADPTIRAIAKAYVRSEPVLASVNAWFSPAYKPEIEGEAAAQTYHFDMSRCRWLNFFLYLDDVDTNKGPHCFIKGSHRANKKAQHLLKRGYVRIPNEDIYSTFGKHNEVEFVAKKGTIIVEDTIGFHKGKIPSQGYRSMFELVYAVSLFGGAYQKFAIPKSASIKLIEAMKQNPVTYQRYEIEK
jgi:hypothetical protein